MYIVFEKDRMLLSDIKLQKPQDRVVIRENLSRVAGIKPAVIA